MTSEALGAARQGGPLRTRAKPPAEGREEKDSHVSVATGTMDPTIVVDLTALHKPAVRPHGGDSRQWQMLQPAGLPPTPPEVQKSVSVSNDLWIGAVRPPRSSSLTGSGGLCPADSLIPIPDNTRRLPPYEPRPPGSGHISQPTLSRSLALAARKALPNCESAVSNWGRYHRANPRGPNLITSRGTLSSIDPARSWLPLAGSNGDRRPVSLPRACRNGAGTNPHPLRGCWSNSWAIQEPSPASPSGQAGARCPRFITTSHNGSRWSGAHSK